MKAFKDSQFDKACEGRITYGFYGRKGGVSTGIYAGLNCGTGSNDDQKLVAKNRSMIAQDMNVADGKVSTLWQCHSAICMPIKSHVPEGEARPKADALATDVAGLAIGILTADCGPVLFVADKADGSPVIGAAHAGWGGALGGVLEDTVAKMIDLGAESSTIKACLGPCIMQPSYEVSEAFAEPFLEKHPEAEKFFMAARKAGHLMFDMPGYIAYRLSLAGVRQVSLMGLDTYADAENFYSFRRATHEGETDYGREMSAIVING
jgi:YfiH family protein